MSILLSHKNKLIREKRELIVRMASHMCIATGHTHHTDHVKVPAYNYSKCCEHGSYVMCVLMV